MNPRIEKLKAEKQKNEAKISELEARNSVLADKIQELENLEIINIVRDGNYDLDQLAELLASTRKEGAADV